MAHAIRMSLLRGLCQIPAFVAYEKGLSTEARVEPRLEVVATAWMVPEKLACGATDFGVISWTRVAAGAHDDWPLVAGPGSGGEEAALGVRKGIDPCGYKILHRSAAPQPTGCIM